MKIARPLPLVALLGVGHAVSDGTAGLLIGHLTAIVPVAEVGALLLLYNALAFAAQPAIGSARRSRSSSTRSGIRQSGADGYGAAD